LWTSAKLDRAKIEMTQAIAMAAAHGLIVEA